MLTLEKVTPRNVYAVMNLTVAESQQDFVATNTESLAEAYVTVTAGGVALPFAICADGTPVGFVMIGYGDLDWEDAPAVARDNYCIWRFMIDRAQQGKGYGRQALQLILDYIATRPCGEAACCYLSYEPENTVAKALYASFGFRENGEKDGTEVIAVRPMP